MNGATPKKSPEELRAERRHQRWKAFLNPFITLTSLVASVALLMFFIKTCSERFPGTP
jgi:hypothetical protein